MKEEMIAPCGMNCGICKGHLREKKKCPGCRGSDTNKSPSRVKCVIKNCEVIKMNQSGFCFECRKYPCRKLRQLDKRYRTKYLMSMIENLEYIGDNGIQKLLVREQEKWQCPECGGVVCCHDDTCYSCGQDILVKRKRETN